MGPVERAFAVVWVCAGLTGCGEKVKPIDRDVPIRRSADASARAEKDAPPVVKGDYPVIDVDDTGLVTLDGAPAGDTKVVRERNRMAKLDGLFSALKEKREAWKQNRPGDPFPGVVGLRVGTTTPAIILKSAFQTAAFAGYPNITIQVRGSSDMYDAGAQIPGPPDPRVVDMPPPERIMNVTVGSDGAEIAWKRGLEILSTSTIPRADLERRICEEWKRSGEHTDPSDPRVDHVVLHVDDALTSGDVAPYLGAVQRCTRKRADGKDGRALDLTFSVR